ncbi:FBD-associated F-box protein At2g26860-like isoform X1 [Salvia hispanica]|uniref:FBD-associated F-box protein At2g26860-like isoform X1 n=1 Tax=Salvia hispanica TaxID=49212 RepID=UPI0020092830|nr:FBD-associated F-box protein At2g26860-like isoform X1 [Salvia hispanica]
MGNEDRISNLPTDLLISIISRLTILEATTTSILSTRWRYLHHYVTRLNFPIYLPRVDADVWYFASAVTRVLRLHRGGRIKEFRMCMSGCFNYEIVEWFEFALSKKAEIIHLRGIRYIDYEALFLRLRNKNNGFECLKDLCLLDPLMSDQDLELLLSNCIALESLELKNALMLENVSIVGHTKLKHLNLTYLKVHSIVIRDAISLVSLTLRILFNRHSVQLSNTPKLTQLYLEAFFPIKLLDELLTGMPACIRDQLQIMHITAKVTSICEMYDMYDMYQKSWVDFVNVKHLELTFIAVKFSLGPYFLCNFFRLVRLVEACSSLDKLVIKLPILPPSHDECTLETYVVPRCELSPKYLEISRYSGAPSQLALTLYLIDNASRFLQKVSVVAQDEEALARARHDFEHIASVSFSVM